jgi:hypothetical protein
MELSLQDLKALIGVESKENPFRRWMGKNVFIRTVTFHYTGLLADTEGKSCAILENAAWIADDGRLTEAMATGEFSEVEIYKYPIGINWGAVLDITEIDKLPDRQK